ncbi:MAG TPA: NADP-dependent oxidoreductase [Steroidobacter sp.]|jgi:NADPH-dependent curcumin reductase CurA|nr:NADP-dependent oxidoreductase [Steroidobacteraceae bacterium]HLS81736.1 NADP-dependent oxidoreductase [Steroidobacter sp.]
MAADSINRRIVLAARPVGAPTAACFRMEEHPAPEPKDGEMLLRTLWLSLDPYMRGRMSDAPSYAAPVAVGAVMVGGAVCRVEESRRPDFQPGDLVQAYTGWQDYAVSDGAGVIKLDPSMPRPSHALGVLGMPGFTAYVGLLDIGAPQPGETVVVAAATGPVGSTVGQIARIKGARTVGIAGGPQKCDYAVREFGFDACIDHKDPDFPKLLAAACPKGIDVYFENVGGAVFDAVTPLLNTFARIPVCGLISRYNATSLPQGPDRLPLLQTLLLIKRMRMQGFIISDHAARIHEFQRDMRQWVKEGRVKTREDVVEGLENAPTAFLGLLEGKNFGKLVVKVAD